MNRFHDFLANLKLMKRKPFFLWVVCFLILAPALSVTTSNFKTREKLKRIYVVRSKLALIPPDEKAELEYLFRHLMFHSHFAYVLFGDKPMSFDDFIRAEHVWKHFMHDFTSFERALELCKFQRGWAIWEKYRYLFPHKNFILIQQKAPNSPERTTIFFIHRENFLRMISEHNKDFGDILGQDFNPEEILSCFYSTEDTMDKKLKRHPVLLGILLGYGSGNAWNYYNLNKLRSKVRKDPSLYKEFIMTQEKFIPFSVPNADLECPIYLPMFLCDPKSKETLCLKRKYKAQRADMYKKYQKGDFLEVTLLKLTE